MQKYNTQYIRLFIFISVMTLFSGCTYYSYKDIQVLTPSESKILSNGKNLTILHNSYYRPQDELKAQRIDTIHQFALEGLYYSLDDYGNIPFIIDSINKIRVNEENKINYSDWQKIHTLAEEQNSNLILILDETDFEVESDFFFNDMGYVDAYSDYIIANRWIFIDPVDQKVIKEEVNIDTLTYNKLGFFINATIEQLPRTEDVIAELGWETGRMFAEKHIPTWQTRSRLYYELPYDDFNKGVMALRDNKLQEAAAIFRSYTDHKNRKTAALSMYNMAVICELEGEYDLALAWLRNSMEVKYYPTTQQYIKILKQRIEDLDAISQDY